MDVFSNPKIASLLRQADTTTQMLDAADRHVRADFEEALNSIYADIGRTVHQLQVAKVRGAFGRTRAKVWCGVATRLLPASCINQRIRRHS